MFFINLPRFGVWHCLVDFYNLVILKTIVSPSFNWQPINRGLKKCQCNGECIRLQPSEKFDTIDFSFQVDVNGSRMLKSKKYNMLNTLEFSKKIKFGWFSQHASFCIWKLCMKSLTPLIFWLLGFEDDGI